MANNDPVGFGNLKNVITVTSVIAPNGKLIKNAHLINNNDNCYYKMMLCVCTIHKINENEEKKNSRALK